ncbi:hypothetical protein CCACVL1_18791 [Corchorus capsularis]|uniref:Uncharacterized protein n=1 Tax=Corchorus capsularis TaxID=210143 RepID=A0A1R3HJL9_COCAP|nr:hypothetical protein CCACVL1_18791 [Corchorus capsularis]
MPPMAKAQAQVQVGFSREIR